MMSNFSRRYLVFPFDFVFMVVSFFLAHWIRYENFSFLEDRNLFFTSLVIVVSVRSVIFLLSGIYRSIWSYASIHDLVEIIKTTLLSSLVSTTMLLFYNRFSQLSRMVPILDTLLLLSFLCIRSFSWRMIRDEIFKANRNTAGTKPVILVGAGKLGATFLGEIRRHKELNFQPVGFIDEDQGKIGGHIQGVPILGNLDVLEDAIRSNSVQQVIITMSHPDGKFVTQVVKICDKCQVPFKILPGLGELLLDAPKIKQLREVEVEDLLGRSTVKLEVENIQSYLKGKRILITGAGGSIGSELCRQVMYFEPETLILLDAAETPLYEIEYEMRNRFTNKTKIHPVVADVKNLSRLSHVFEVHQPQVVFHSAAYKHVPMMEINSSEAVLNNVMGTKNLADVSRLTGVERFVLISTDKAVNPVNIMGVSKRVAELYLQHISVNSRTKFITVRFGNVLGSNGSVIPRFREQIKRGGPVTVTHPDIIRYFMTISEASQLVLQAGSMGEHGEIFILDMGEPVRISNLAEEMIRLSGYTPNKDIKIEYTGLRPGEKLFEELMLDQEGIKKTHHPKIRIAAPLQSYNLLLFQNKLNTMFSMAKANKDAEIYKLFQELVPEYVVHNDYIQTTRKIPL
ncbi:polysaccharide biosynthesis protein [Leptospira sp. GIMC2001]|uniref:polysaccharide biosynthesis protein n=1 Tax=Leptospira sp. GIMC2001 TaxID=1513297 RepID=UPI002349A82E|nr:nucleoside-diphosphate sugar epimerase/dehydratase [Leptospira sp. GIMC2001]WCL47826.1 nucleoside-diphosphate sugar epimerase/dehydratase [Leptospira sp. GIMC2001]